MKCNWCFSNDTKIVETIKTIQNMDLKIKHIECNKCKFKFIPQNFIKEKERDKIFFT